MTILTKNSVQEALNAAVEARGADYVYTETDTYTGNCYYAQEGPDGSFAPSCVVGFVVDAIDHEAFERLAEAEATDGTFSVGEIFGYDEIDLGYEDDRITEALAFAQEAQDEGLPWGQARDFAVRYLEGGSYFTIREELTRAIHKAKGWD